tara:strand:- start:1353 stop:1724 length:372 start_codon:yes stop_codon:yes gene_type:complete
MGASEFINVAEGKTADAAFKKLVEQAQWEHGHAGYSGTIAEKRSIAEFSRPKGMRRATVIEAVRALRRIMHDDDGDPKTAPVQAKYPKLPIGAMFEVYDDKWGPALAIQLRKGEYLFAGFASS